MKHKIIAGILICVFGVFFYLFHLIYSDAKEKAIDDLNARQMILAKQAQNGIEYYYCLTQPPHFSC